MIDRLALNKFRIALTNSLHEADRLRQALVLARPALVGRPARKPAARKPAGSQASCAQAHPSRRARAEGGGDEEVRQPSERASPPLALLAVLPPARPSPPCSPHSPAARR